LTIYTKLWWKYVICTELCLLSNIMSFYFHSILELIFLTIGNWITSANKEKCSRKKYASYVTDCIILNYLNGATCQYINYKKIKIIRALIVYQTSVICILLSHEPFIAALYFDLNTTALLILTRSFFIDGIKELLMNPAYQSIFELNSV